ncbi:LanC-like protein 3 like [Pseudolycoriella hygida]|uniref:LanC-like protein 3 like n=1 Tax=Pseudolycoriella hygida TaxID=35572 RepID=A0A9Q0NDQ7_9DIPT|nr:LanC-like protein 3 like [Pseudolycoriella hygida]
MENTKKYFDNPYEDYEGGGFAPDNEFLKYLVFEYTGIISENTFPKESPYRDRKLNLLVGNAGIAYMFLKMHHSPHDFSDLQPLFHAQEYITDAKNKIPPHSKLQNQSDPCALLNGSAGIYCVSAVISSLWSQDAAMRRDVINFNSGFEMCKLIDFTEHGRDSLFVGRAGYLSGVYFLNKHIKHMGYNDDQIMEVCRLIIESGREYSMMKGSRFPLLYPYYDCEHLGALYGLSSILLVLLASPLFHRCPDSDEFLHISEDTYDLVQSTVDRLLEFQDEEGHFPATVEDNEVPYQCMKLPSLVQWCTDSPGIIYLLIKSYEIFRDVKYLDAARKVTDVIWKYGLLTAGPSLCHGVAGNGYAFLVMYRVTGETKFLYRAFRFAQFLRNPEFLELPETEAYKYSLFEGLAGVVCFLLDLMDPLQASFPFMDIS